MTLLETLRRKLDDVDYALMYEQRALAPDPVRIRSLTTERAYIQDNISYLRRRIAVQGS